MEIKALFDHRYRFGVHIVQCVLVAIGIILALVSMAIPGGFMTRAHIMALSMVRGFPVYTH